MAPTPSPDAAAVIPRTSAVDQVCLDAAVERIYASLPPLLQSDTRASAEQVAKMLAVVMGAPLPAEHVLARLNRIGRYQQRLTELLGDRGITQRTPEWYQARQTMVTASDVAQALGRAKYGSQKQFYQKKCCAGGDGPDAGPFASGAALPPPLKWGVMFEPVANAIYASRNVARIHEFGLLRHRTVPFLGASPDGITHHGVMLEIKCPWRRKINGEVPLQYYYQIQAQLEVCGLEECDYVECEFEEALGGADEVARDEEHAAAYGDAPLDPCSRGVFLEFAVALASTPVPSFPPSPDEPAPAPAPAHTATTTFYVYPPDHCVPLEKLVRWAASETERVNREKGGGDNVFTRQHWWRLNKYGVVRVVRDPEFVQGMLDQLAPVWDRVLHYRSDREAFLREVGDPKPPTPRPCRANAERDLLNQAGAKGDPVLAPFAFVDEDDS